MIFSGLQPEGKNRKKPKFGLRSSLSKVTPSAANSYLDGVHNFIDAAKNILVCSFEGPCNVCTDSCLEQLEADLVTEKLDAGGHGQGAADA